MLAFWVRVNSGPPPFAFSDNFNAADGALAAPWVPITGTWTRASGLAHTTATASSNPLCVVDASWGDIDASVSTSTAGGGDCLYFRVTDATNWMRVRSRKAIGSYSYGSWVDQGFYTLSPGDDAYMNPAYSNQTVTVSDTAYEVFNSGPTGFELFTRSKTANYSYSAVVEKSVAGTITALGTPFSSFQNAVSSLRVVALGSSIMVYVNGSKVATYTDSTGATATKHGIGRGSPTDVDSSAIDNFSISVV